MHCRMDDLRNIIEINNKILHSFIEVENEINSLLG